MPWFRLWNEVLHDSKIKRIARITGQSKALLVGAWVTLLVLASESSQRGKLLISDDIPINLDDIMEETGLNAEACQIVLDSFQEMEMITESGGIFEITNWDVRQRASDNSTERSRRSRARKRDRNKAQRRSNGDATLQGVASVVIESESDIESDIESDSESESKAEIELDKKWGSIFSLYSDNINTSESPLTIEEMMTDEYLGLPLDWWQQAIKIAGDRNVRKWSYVRGILNKSIERGASPDTISEEMKSGNDKINTRRESNNGRNDKAARGDDGVDSGILGESDLRALYGDAGTSDDW